jgi:hypothetical protein
MTAGSRLSRTLSSQVPQMTHRSWISLATISCVLNLSAPPAHAAPLDDLRQAREEYETVLDSAKAAVTEKYRELITKYTQKSDTVALQEAGQLQRELKEFDESGILWGRSEMTASIKAYCGVKYAAAQKLRDVYITVIQQLRDADEEVDADATQAEMMQFPWPGDLKSLKRDNTSDFVFHYDYLGVCGRLKKDDDRLTKDQQRLNSTWEVVPGLIDQRFVSFRAVNQPGHYLVTGLYQRKDDGRKDDPARNDFRIKLHRDDETAAFRSDATFKVVENKPASSGFLYESLTRPGRFIRVRNGELWLDQSDGSLQFKREATFRLVDPQVKLW